MSVPFNERSTSRLEAFSKSLALCKYTILITDNKKVFSVEHQESLTRRIVDAAVSIHSDAWKANNIVVNSRDSYAVRNALQSTAIASCYELLSLIDIAKPVFHLETRRIVYWTKLVLDARNLLRAWRDSDADRYRSYRQGM